LEAALEEINRVLKPGGVLMANAPIHNHGDPRFLRGELSKIMSAFKKKLWKIKVVEQCYPSVKIQGWKKLSSKGILNRAGYPDFLLQNPKKDATYILNIHAVKKGKKKKQKAGSNSLRHLIVILRFIKIYIKSRLF
jgi:hypothetical protein